MYAGRRSRLGDRDGGAQLVEESAAFLTGQAQELYERRRQPVPTWARLSAVAHAHPASVRYLAEAHHLEFHPWGSWAWAVGRLANVMVAMAPDDQGLEQLQRTCLVPMELELVGDPEVPVVAATQVLSEACARLRAPHRHQT